MRRPQSGIAGNSRSFPTFGTVCMKTIFLMRHSKSAWKEEGMDDFDRPLNKRGTGDAHFMAGILMLRGERPDLIVSSPAVRAASTALIVARETGVPAGRIILAEAQNAQTLQLTLSQLGNRTPD